MIKFACDICGKELDKRDDLNVFRLWQLKAVDIVLAPIEDYNHDIDYHLCDECMVELFNHVDGMRAVEP